MFRNNGVPSPSYPSASTSVARDPQEYTMVSSASSLPPSESQLAAMHALPASMVRPVLRRQTGGGKRGKKRADFVARFFNPVAGRPYPTITRLQQMIRVTDEYTGVLFQTSTTVPVYAGLAFRLSDFALTTPYLNVFDQYKIERIEIWVETVAAQGSTSFDQVSMAIDLDDANVPTSFSEVDAKQGVLVGNGGAGKYMAWEPHMAVAAYSGAFTSYSNVPAGWIDSASPNVQHFGIKAAASPTGVSQYHNFRARATIAFRAPGL